MPSRDFDPRCCMALTGSPIALKMEPMPPWRAVRSDPRRFPVLSLCRLRTGPASDFFSAVIRFECCIGPFQPTPGGGKPLAGEFVPAPWARNERCERARPRRGEVASELPGGVTSGGGFAGFPGRLADGNVETCAVFNILALQLRKGHYRRRGAVIPRTGPRIAEPGSRSSENLLRGRRVSLQRRATGRFEPRQHHFGFTCTWRSLKITVHGGERVKGVVGADAHVEAG